MDQIGRELVENFDTILDTIHDDILIADGSGRVIRLSPTFEEVYGLEKEKAIGRTVYELEKEGYFRPYLFVILDGSRTLEEVAALLKDTLDEHEYPVEIRVITERPYFHFKTNRKELTAQILEELQQAE